MDNRTDDRQAIRQAALDYVEGWYDGDTDRMARCLHPSLVKRTVKRLSPNGREYLNYLTREEMVVGTAEGGGTHVPKDRRQYTITILDLYGEIAAVRAENPDWIDYLQLARIEGQWVIVNVLYTINHANQYILG
ncbi:MAG: hypothetical protein AMJ56_19990 [Anaerolineae bacterium SG8_19]|nr:MAG: hypothetical protein AMJ56_19990 [Anaerolineae bacterium SG8_19]